MRRKHHELLPQEGLDEPFGPHKPMDIRAIGFFFVFLALLAGALASPHAPSVVH